ncbi:hypothetical protein HDU67_001982 [Dinochytrium kinnereticum]|nr:hypothetical protein HDU67_001982 [Dinochytrium kinnereticum]
MLATSSSPESSPNSMSFPAAFGGSNPAVNTPPLDSPQSMVGSTVLDAPFSASSEAMLSMLMQDPSLFDVPSSRSSSVSSTPLVPMLGGSSEGMAPLHQVDFSALFEDPDLAPLGLFDGVPMPETPVNTPVSAVSSSWDWMPSQSVVDEMICSTSTTPMEGVVGSFSPSDIASLLPPMRAPRSLPRHLAHSISHPNLRTERKQGIGDPYSRDTFGGSMNSRPRSRSISAAPFSTHRNAIPPQTVASHSPMMPLFPTPEDVTAAAQHLMRHMAPDQRVAMLSWDSNVVQHQLQPPSLMQIVSSSVGGQVPYAVSGEEEFGPLQPDVFSDSMYGMPFPPSVSFNEFDASSRHAFESFKPTTFPEFGALWDATSPLMSGVEEDDSVMSPSSTLLANLAVLSGNTAKPVNGIALASPPPSIASNTCTDAPPDSSDSMLLLDLFKTSSMPPLFLQKTSSLAAAATTDVINARPVLASSLASLDLLGASPPGVSASDSFGSGGEVFRDGTGVVDGRVGVGSVLSVCDGFGDAIHVKTETVAGCLEKEEGLVFSFESDVCDEGSNMQQQEQHQDEQPQPSLTTTPSPSPPTRIRKMASADSMKSDTTLVEADDLDGEASEEVEERTEADVDAMVESGCTTDIEDEEYEEEENDDDDDDDEEEETKRGRKKRGRGGAVKASVGRVETLKGLEKCVGGGESQFSCICGKLFKKLSSLKTHYKQHEKKERKFVCEVCDRGFTPELDIPLFVPTTDGEVPFTL